MLFFIVFSNAVKSRIFLLAKPANKLGRRGIRQQVALSIEALLPLFRVAIKNGLFLLIIIEGLTCAFQKWHIRI